MRTKITGILSLVSTEPEILLGVIYPPTTWVQSRFAETRFAKTLTLNQNPNFGESGFGESGFVESGRHPHLQDTL